MFETCLNENESARRLAAVDAAVNEAKPQQTVPEPHRVFILVVYFSYFSSEIKSERKKRKMRVLCDSWPSTNTGIP